MGYMIAKVARADRFDYPRTAVYFEPGGRTDRDPPRPAARRRDGECRRATIRAQLVVIVGPQTVAGS